MEPHQKHYRAKMREHGWMDEADKMIWPSDTEGRERMARGLFGIEMVSSVDYWRMLAEDELDDTFKAPWAASPGKKLHPDEVARREALKTLNEEQRQAVRDLLDQLVTGELHSFCTALDRTLGGTTITIHPPDRNEAKNEPVEIHSSGQDEWMYEQFQWLKDFSILYGDDQPEPDQSPDQVL